MNIYKDSILNKVRWWIMRKLGCSFPETNHMALYENLEALAAQRNYAGKDLKAILHALYRLDDKPHQLFSLLSHIAHISGVELGFTKDQVDEIIRLCYLAYDRASKMELNK